MINSKSSATFWQIKAFAIYSVFYAHLEWSGEPVAGHIIYKSIGCIGVPLFMLMAGYFDGKSKASMSQKAKRLLIPLLIWGSLTYCLKLLLDPSKGMASHILDYLKWVYGCGTWYYFIAVLFWCQLLVRFVNGWGLALLGVGSMIMTSIDVVPYNEIITPYNNPFNFIIYFVIGRE